MIIRALHSKGILDLSSQHTHKNKESAGEDFSHFSLSLKPGQVVEIDDKYRRLKNIDTAINAGKLEVISYSSKPTSTVNQEELNNIGDENGFVRSAIDSSVEVQYVSVLTQLEYDSLPEKDENTIYFIQ